MTDVFKAKAALYLALVDAPVDVALADSNAPYMEVLMNDPDIKEVITAAFRQEETKCS